MINLSAWDSVPGVKRLSPQLSPAHIIVEFDRTKKPKIFAHQLGKVEFGPGRDINSDRQKIIEHEVSNIGDDGFRYNNIGYVYSRETLSPPSNNRHEVYAHGHPKGGAQYRGKESCSRYGLVCANGLGSDAICSAGHCVIGHITHVKETKWRYESVNRYGDNNLPVVYFFAPAESVNLKTILRGRFEALEITSPASISTTLYLPPKFYFSEDFLDTDIISVDQRLEKGINPPTSSTIGVNSRKNLFIQKFIVSVYPGTSEGYLNNQLYNAASEQIKIALKEYFEKLPEVWKEGTDAIIEEEWSLSSTGLEFISASYDRIAELFKNVLQVTPSSLKRGGVSYSKSTMARPIYSRLPGMAEAYRSDPAFSDTETPSQWLLSGADEFLSSKKDDISSFYQNYLNPETCSAEILDWLAQHLGLTGDLWNTEWDRSIKEAMIRNAFGWWDRAVTNEGTGFLTPKGQALSKFPFTKPEWVSSDEDANFLRLKADEIETIKLDAGNYDSYDPFKAWSASSRTELVVVNAPRINKLLWNGLIEAKGSSLAVAFLVSIFGLKAHSPEELEVVNAERKIFKPRNGLRNAEISAPPLVPYKREVLQVGTEADAEVGNHTNQLIAGVSRASSIEESRDVFFRVPYYYNRDGKSWDRTKYIAEKWLPSHLNIRVQYAYLSANLWSVGDGFFEPEVVDVS